MPDTVFDRWFLVIVFSAVLVIVGPLVVVLIILQLPSWLALIATVSIIVLWGVVSGYKDWLVSKRKESEEKHREEDG